MVIKSGDADPSIFGEIDMVFFNQSVTLLLIQPSVCEHPNLLANVASVMTASSFLQVFLQAIAHGFDPPRHQKQLLVPHLSEFWATEHSGD